MAKGYGIEINEWALLGAVAVSGLIAWNMFGSPVSKITNAVATGFETPAKVSGFIAGSVLNPRPWNEKDQAVLDTIMGWFK